VVGDKTEGGNAMVYKEVIEKLKGICKSAGVGGDDGYTANSRFMRSWDACILAVSKQ
jgi:hypothetical protein